jgi:hypothetical protein
MSKSRPPIACLISEVGSTPCSEFARGTRHGGPDAASRGNSRCRVRNSDSRTRVSTAVSQYNLNKRPPFESDPKKRWTSWIRPLLQPSSILSVSTCFYSVPTPKLETQNTRLSQCDNPESKKLCHRTLWSTDEHKWPSKGRERRSTALPCLLPPAIAASRSVRQPGPAAPDSSRCA